MSSSGLVTRRAHTDSGALSLLITNYVLSLVALLIVNGTSVNIARLLLVTGLVVLNFVSLVKVHLSLVSRRRLRDYLLFLINVAPYAALLVYPGLWLLIPTVPLVLFLTEVARGRGRSVLANVSGTTLVASSFIAWYVLMGGELINRVVVASLLWTAYHAFSALYVEGKLPFRRGVMPYHSSILWFASLPMLAYGMYMTMGLPSLIILAEPTVRALIAVKEGKLSTEGFRLRIRRVGVSLLIESLVIAALTLVFLYVG